MSENDASQFQPTLKRANATLRNALDEACRVDVERLNTGELIRIEEVLAIANEAAKEVVSVRRRLSHERRGDEASSPSTSTRELADEQGTKWAVFAVVPTASNDRPTVRERFRDGWLSFDSGAETRRLVPIPSGWQALSDDELRRLCSRAEPTLRRTSTVLRPRSSGPSGS